MNICVIGGGGYAGSALVPRLLNSGHEVTVLDAFYYGNHLTLRPGLKMLKGDVRNKTDVEWAIRDNEAVIHLACISNDPSFDLNPRIAKSINLDCFHHFVNAVKRLKPKRVIYASSSSVYGVSDEPNVTEDSPCRPITDYSRYKLKCEEMLLKAELESTVTILRPATLCGFAPRLRLDVIINALTAKALATGEITVHGGEQIRPNLNVEDMARAYEFVLMGRPGVIDKQIYNVGDENKSVNELAFLVQSLIPSARIKREPVIDQRSYRVDSSKIKKDLNFAPTQGLSSAILSLRDAYSSGLIGDIDSPGYHNLKKIKELLSRGDMK